MELKEFAKRLDNRQYAYPQFSSEEIARSSGFARYKEYKEAAQYKNEKR